MLLFLGLLSLIQICVLPGLLVMRLFKTNTTNLIENVAFVFGFSLISNYLLVFLLTSLGIYHHTLMLAIFGLETLAFLWIYKDSLSKPINESVAPFLLHIRDFFSSWSFPSESKGRDSNWASLLRVLLFFSLLAFALSTLTWIGKIIYENRLTVFSVWDTVVSWNSWAVTWATNQIPENTRRYGQLIPTNWSITYVFMGSSQIQFFAKAIAPIFTLLILLLTISLGLELRSYGFFVAAIFIQLMFKKLLGVHVYSGYVDTAVTFFSFSSLYCLIKAYLYQDPKEKISYILIGAIMAGGAFCTKQPGLYILAAYPVIAYFAIYRGSKELEARGVSRVIIFPSLIALAVSLPWYMYTEIAILFGNNKTEFSWILEDVHRGRNLLDRFLYGVGLLDKYVILFAIGLLLLPFVKSIYRWVYLAIALPYFMAWALFASYSERNLAIVFPIVALVSGVGLEQLFEFVQRRAARLKFKNFPIQLAAFALIIIALLSSLLVPNPKLAALQTTLQKDILIRGVNKDLYKYFDGKENDQLVLSGYPLENLPGFENLTVSDSYEEFATFERHLEEYPDIGFLLVPPTVDERILAQIGQLEAAGKYTFLFDSNKYRFYAINK